MKRTSRSRVLGVGAVAAVAAGGLVGAAVRGDIGVVNGCYDARSGQLRIVDTEAGVPRGCGNNELLVSWNKQGSPGLVDPTGPHGPTGAAVATVAPRDHHPDVGGRPLGRDDRPDLHGYRRQC